MEQQQIFTINFTLSGLQAIVDVLRKLPNESNLYPLLKDIEQQAIDQVKDKEEVANEDVNEDPLA
jgi:Tfp pilus assembly protein PilO